MPLGVSVAIVAAVAWPYWAWLYRVCASLHYNDFGKFYYSVQAWREGRSLYALTPASFIGDLPVPLTNLNPPHAMLLVWPFSFLPVDLAFALWMIVNAACLGYALLAVRRSTGWQPTLWQVVVLLAGAPTATWLVTGQLTGILCVPLVHAWLGWRRGALERAGVWIGVAIAIKPFLGLFLLCFAWRREWRALAAALGAVAASFLCGVGVFGLEEHYGWKEAVEAVSWTWGAMNASLLGILTRSLSVTPYHAPITTAPMLITPVWLCLVTVAGVTLVRRLSRSDVDLSWGLLITAALLLSPLGWTYYLWWALPGLRRLLSGPLSILLLLPLPIVALTVFPHPTAWLTITFGSAYAWAVLASFISGRAQGASPSECAQPKLWPTNCCGHSREPS
jgi:alpha-1,2-mannosyltransferase